MPSALAPPSTPTDRPTDADPRSDRPEGSIVSGVLLRRGPFRPVHLVPARARVEARSLARMFRAFDAAAIIGAAALLWLLARDVSGAPMGLAPFALSAAALLFGLHAFEAYDFAHREPLLRHMVRVLAALGFTALTVLLALRLTGRSPSGHLALKAWFAGILPLLIGLHAAWWTLIDRGRREGHLTPNVVLVGATANAERFIAAALKNREVNVLGIFDDRHGRSPGHLLGVPVLGDTSALVDHRIMPYVDRVVIAVTASAQGRIHQLMERLSVLPNTVCLFVDDDGVIAHAAVSQIADSALTELSGGPADSRRALVKRTQDLVLGGLGLLALTPLMLVVALAVRLDSPGPIFFRQRRHGFNNEEILVWKFRSMRHADADHTASRQISAGDDRVTRVGRFIRATSLDELPQLFNVLRGEMSLVGPRPHAIGMKTGEIESAKLVAQYAHRHRMKPGLTGWAAINGSRGPVDTPE
ncbi:MAG: hypothetical protein JWP92_3577, partial [Caulobacter sp.]|nr:hypothetical protein [Caulobacter sp.]